MKHTCCAHVSTGDSWGRIHHPRVCGKTAKVERDGKHYCGTHDPVRRAEKRAETNARWHAEMAESQSKQRLVNSAPKLLASLEAMCAMWASVCSANGHDPAHMTQYLTAEEVIREAKGEAA